MGKQHFIQKHGAFLLHVVYTNIPLQKLTCGHLKYDVNCQSSNKRNTHHGRSEERKMTKKREFYTSSAYALNIMIHGCFISKIQNAGSSLTSGSSCRSAASITGGGLPSSQSSL